MSPPLSRRLTWPVLIGLWLGLLAPAAHPARTTFNADPEYLIDTWETEDGLPENSATALAQAPDGYLWFGTFNGLVRFDGAHFHVLDRMNTPQLPAADAINLHLDGRGRLWVSTSRGLVVREGSRWRPMNLGKGGPANYVRSFAERADGGLLLTTFDGRHFEFTGGDLAELPAPPAAPGMATWASPTSAAGGGWCSNGSSARGTAGTGRRPPPSPTSSQPSTGEAGRGMAGCGCWPEPTSSNTGTDGIPCASRCRNGRATCGA